MRTYLIMVFCILGLAACTGAPVARSQANIVDDGQLLVLTATNPQVVIDDAVTLGYLLERVERLDQLGDTLIHLRIPAGRTIPSAIEEIEALHPEVTAGANHAYRLQSLPSELDFANDMIGWPANGCRAQQKIGLIDAGVMAGHPGLATGQITQEVTHLSQAAPTTDHGTLMADLLVGDGRLNGARLYSANAIDPAAAGGDAAGVDAILRSVNWLRTEDVALVNISLAGPFNKLLNRALGQAASDGMILVAAAGNRGPSAPPQYPAAFPFVVAVTAVDRDLAAYRRAGQGPHIDLAAPGVDIAVNSGGRLRVLSGTSAAAPYVTAVIAADSGFRSVRSKEAAVARLTRTATDLGPSGKDQTFGFGLVSAPASCLR